MPKTPRSVSKSAIIVKNIRKRDGTLVEFNVTKISEAIFRSSAAVGEADWERAQTLASEVVAQLSERRPQSAVPTVEEVQDVVERTLINNGLAKVAKAYILYRQHRSQLRKEKALVLNKAEEAVDEVDKCFDINALRVLAARYLNKGDDGSIIESPKELFTRVAVHTTLPSLLYDKKIYRKVGKKNEVKQLADFDPVKNESVYSVGEYKLNRFHLEALKRMFDRLTLAGQLKVDWKEFLTLIKGGYFDKYAAEAKDYYTLMVERKFMPNTPAVANFGSHLGMGSACFVLGIEDNIGDIMDKLKAACIIFKSGGGVGYNFSHLRPEGDFVKTTGGVASGPLSFMSMFDNMTDVIKQGGIRRGANMGIMNSSHPDILKFIKAKEGNKALRNFNISIYLEPDFWTYYDKKEPYPLVNPRNKKRVGYVDPQQLFDLVAYHAWESAEPGLLFGDHINKYNPFLDALGPIETTNPCGEVLLYPNESCNLGSINVWAFTAKKNGDKPAVDWVGLERAIRLATKFLDNVVDINKYPLKAIEDMTLATRKLGLGVMGVADALYELDTPYNSKDARAFMEELMEFVNYHSKVVSIDLAKERGPMPYYDKSFYTKGKLPIAGPENEKNCRLDWKKISRDIKAHGVRNGYTTVIAPTGSISMIAGCSSGIEPVYSLVFEKNVAIGSFYYVDPVFEARMQKEGLMDEALLRDVSSRQGSVQHIAYIPDKLKKTLITAHDIQPDDHIRALAAFQQWTDSSISKTNNFPADASVEDIKEAYTLAYELGCKGVTVYRDGSIQSQVLVAPGEKDKKVTPKKEGEVSAIKDEKAKGLAVYKKEGSYSADKDQKIVKEPDVCVEDEYVDTNAPKKCKTCQI
jgi:ribonucleoside-diphosphate reductase alpha chain